MNDIDIKGKKILLFAPKYYSLYKDIIESLESLGAQVKYVPDVVQRLNPHYNKCLFKSIKKIYHRWFNPNRKYLLNYKQIFSEYWDIIICIDGYSFDRSIFELLKKRNERIKTILYLWDDLGYYDYTYSFNFFDSIFTFDYNDSVKYGLKYLPLYWKIPNLKDDCVNKKYDVSFIGSLHSDRYEILNRIVEQCKKEGITYYIKLIVGKQTLSHWDKIKYTYLRNKKDFNSLLFCQECDIIRKKIKNDIISLQPIPSDDICRIMNESRCIIDIVKPGQNGLSNRAITALALRKKILSTIESKAELFNHLNTNINLLDRENPSVDIQFVKSSFETSDAFNAEIELLEITNWVKYLINK